MNRASLAGTRVAVLDAILLAVACLVAFILVTKIVPRVYTLSRADDLIGALWAVIATVFVFRDSYASSMSAAVSRVAATSVSFALCLAYLAFLPFHEWALALLIAVSVLAVHVIGRPGDAATAAITTAVVLVAAAVSPQHAWQQPILRLATRRPRRASASDRRRGRVRLGLRITGPRAKEEN